MIYLDACDPPPSWNTETLETQLNLWPGCYSRRCKRPREKIQVECKAQTYVYATFVERC
ncbi:unnamed protein product [Hymenolepis diminuta]|uniref:Uncharacterized protein n=1 Tax=Hymenolepis diminuta TaxID=6216 RepID=A0A564Z1Y9_HYMDI|nr:unnamed protein product [Hymenolepis diminuta]